MVTKSMSSFALLIIVYTITVEHSESAFTVSVKGEYEKLGDGWYDPSDQVVMLDYKNLTSVIGNGTTAWFVEFYKSWCGDCQRFTPKWISFVKSVIGWSDVVKVAAIACSNDVNFPICQSYGIKTVPTVKYFSIGDLGLGINVTRGTEEGTEVGAEESLRQRLIEKLQQDQQNGKGGDDWPDLAPYRNNDPEHWKTALPPSVIYHFFLFENNTSYLGSEVILDLYKLKNLQIRRVTEDNVHLLRMYNITAFPSLIVLDREGSTLTRLELPEPTQEGTTKVIKTFMQSKGLLLEPVEHTQENTSPSAQNNQPNTPRRPMKDVLYEADLQSTLGYTLNREISQTEFIEGEAMTAVKDYLQVLSKYFPLQEGNSEFLTALYDEVSQRSNMTGQEFGDLVKLYEQKFSPVFASHREWVGCRGSRLRWRGYPCGLWTLFHTLTARHAREYKNGNVESQSGGMILRAMYGYIKNFFSCEGCSKHFVGMAAERNLFDVQTADDAVLWLWEAHNEVNRRLSGDVTEDPEFPKIEYPSREHCRACRNSDGSWNRQGVVNYLKWKYGYSRIISTPARVSVDRK